MQSNSFLLAAAIILFTGFIFAGFAAFDFYQDYTLEKNGVRVEGTVTGLVMNQDDEGSTSYAPVVRFTTRGGREYTFQSNFFSSPPQYKTGQTVTVLYPTDQPGEAKIKGEGQLLRIIFGLVGGSEILLGLFFAGKALLAHNRGE